MFIRQDKNLIHSLTATTESAGAKRRLHLCGLSKGKAMPEPSAYTPQGINKHSGTSRRYNEFSLLYNHGYKGMTHREDVFILHLASRGAMFQIMSYK